VDLMYAIVLSALKCSLYLSCFVHLMRAVSRYAVYFKVSLILPCACRSVGVVVPVCSK